MRISLSSIINFVLLLLSGMLMSCRHSGTKGNTSAHVITKSVAVTTASFYDEIKGYGTLNAVNSLDLEAKFDGIVHFSNLKENIKKGEVVFRLQGPEIELKLEALKRNINNAKIQYDYFKTYYDAQKKLMKDKYLASIDFENAAKEFESAQNTLSTAQYELKYFYSMTSFRAPFDGYLDNLKVPQGEDAVAGQVLGTFQNDNYLKLEAEYYGDPDSLSTKDFLIRIDGTTYTGKLIYKGKAINSSSGGHTIWVALKDSLHRLKSGDYVSFSFLGHKHESVAVPEAAIVQQESNYFVITIKDGKYYKTAVQIGKETNGLVEIISGVKKGTQVLTQGAFEVFYGNLSKVMNVSD